eukprot:TRINITY_DN8931_c0_g1_i1.p1 TRINITY_DN8931_c0_g1~~TRINITY_DN8931_c0_g1_i1.p1  ORF type:complete len:279 (+),score=11.89 TRINITY_DN8931_c0_g1_i1:112-948(+)
MFRLGLALPCTSLPLLWTAVSSLAGLFGFFFLRCMSTPWLFETLQAWLICPWHVVVAALLGVLATAYLFNWHAPSLACTAVEPAEAAHSSQLSQATSKMPASLKGIIAARQESASSAGTGTAASSPRGSTIGSNEHGASSPVAFVASPCRRRSQRHREHRLSDPCIGVGLPLSAPEQWVETGRFDDAVKRSASEMLSIVNLKSFAARQRHRCHSASAGSRQELRREAVQFSELYGRTLDVLTVQCVLKPPSRRRSVSEAELAAYHRRFDCARSPCWTA